MNRVINPGELAQPQSPPPQAGHAATASGSPTVAQSEKTDVLAGALPSWDLLPATPFIRRVK